VSGYNTQSTILRDCHSQAASATNNVKDLQPSPNSSTSSPLEKAIIRLSPSLAASRAQILHAHHAQAGKAPEQYVEIDKLEREGQAQVFSTPTCRSIAARLVNAAVDI
jgi:hypothetical protein